MAQYIFKNYYLSFVANVTRLTIYESLYSPHMVA